MHGFHADEGIDHTFVGDNRLVAVQIDSLRPRSRCGYQDARHRLTWGKSRRLPNPAASCLSKQHPKLFATQLA